MAQTPKSFIPDSFIPDNVPSTGRGNPTPTPTPIMTGRASGPGPGRGPGPVGNVSDEPRAEYPAWKFLTEPLTNLPSRGAKRLSRWIDPEHTGNWTPRTVTSAFIESLGNVGDEMTSPVNAATFLLPQAAAFSAAKGLPTTAKLLDVAGRVSAAPVLAQGVQTMVDPNTTWGERAIGAGESLLGGLGVAGRIPRIGKSVRGEPVSTTPISEPPPLLDVRGNPIKRSVFGDSMEGVDDLLPSSNRPSGSSEGISPAKKLTREEWLELEKQGKLADEKFFAEQKRLGLEGPDTPGVAPKTKSSTAPRDAVILNSDGTYTVTATGEIIGEPTLTAPKVKEGNLTPVPETTTPVPETTPTTTRATFVAPPQFKTAGAYYQQKQLVFANSAERLLFSIGSKIPSKHRNAIAALLKDYYGVDDEVLKKLATDLRNKTRPIIDGTKDSLVYIPEQNPSATASHVGPTLTPTPNVVGQQWNGLPNEAFLPNSFISGGDVPPLDVIPPDVIPPTQTGRGNVPPIIPPTTPPAAVGGGSGNVPNNAAKIIANANNAARVTPEGPLKESLYRKVHNFLRTTLTSYDLSAPLRQGKGLITHKEFWTSFDDMFKSYGNEKAYNLVKESIMEDPSGFFKRGVDIAGDEVKSFAEKAGLDLTDMYGSAKEEMFRSKIAEKYLPGVARSQRAYTAFLNKLRADVFKKLVNQAIKEGRGSLEVAQQIAESINTSTGRGNFGSLEKSAGSLKILNEIFFAPKLAASRIQMYTRVLNPKTYTMLDPIVRREALRSLFGIVGTGIAMGEMARMMGAEVSNDPTNSDFRKIKIGNTRIDNFAGLQQYGVAATRLITGTSASSTTGRTFDLGHPKYGGQTRASVIGNFATNKLAPIPSFVWAWVSGEEFDGTPFEVKQAMVNRIIPIVIQDLYALAKEDPSLLPLGILPVFGEGIQTYGR